MAKLKQALAVLRQKQANLDVMDDELMGMPEMAPEAPMGGDLSPEFNDLSQKREELEEEIRQMREGVQLISEWEKFKGGQWSEDIKRMLGEIDVEITDIAGGEPAPVGDLLGGPMAPSLDTTTTPTPDMGSGAPAALDMPPPADTGLDTPADVDAPPTDDEIPPMDEEPAPPAATPMASAKASAKAAITKKNNYQTSEKKAVSASNAIKLNKDGSTMATSNTEKQSLKDKIAEVKVKREAIKREAQQRVAAAWTIAKTMLPSAPAEKQKEAAANFLQLGTPVLNSMLRQTAKNAHYSKLAEDSKSADFKNVKRDNLNQEDMMDTPAELNAEKSAVKSEIKGEAKNATSPKKADDRKESGPLPEKYVDGRDGSEPKGIDGSNAAKRPEHTINMSEGGDKVAKAKAACGKDCKGCEKCEKKAACADCTGDKKCAKHAAEEEPKAAAALVDDKKEAAADADDTKEAAKDDKKEAAAKKADESAVMDAPPVEEGSGDVPPAPEMDAPPVEEEMPMDAPEGDNAGEIISDEKKMVVQEKVQEVEEAIHAIEKEILEEGTESEEMDFSQIEGDPEPEIDAENGENQELDYGQIFNEENMDEKVSALANENDEHTAGEEGNGEEYFTPTSAANMEASLDEPQIASMDDFFSLRGSDSDPLAHLIAGEIRTAADVAGTDVIPSSTGEAANEFESDAATSDGRNNESDHEGDLFAEAIENVKPEEGGFKRIKQDETNELKAPKEAKAKAASAKKETPVIKKLKPVVAAVKPVDIAAALFGKDDF